MTHRSKLSAKYNRLTGALRRAESKKGTTDLINRLDERLTAVWVKLNLI